MRTRSPGLDLIVVWVGWGALLNVLGWIFSFFHVLGPNAYRWTAIFLAAGGMLFLRGRSWTHFAHKAARRLRRPVPAAFALVTLFTLTGAILTSPSNYDALSYRIPRVMHWLSQGGWFWIPTANARQNYSGVGQEWLLAPLLALSGSDRLFFLPNFLCFILLPSVCFRVLRGLEVTPRAASLWMWLFPFAPVFLLQAGGVANDLLGAFWFLASLALLPGRFIFGAFPGASLLSLGLATGVKASNLVLLLPWLAKFSAGVFLRREVWRPALVALPLAMAISFAPIAIFNHRNTGDWSGDPKNDGGLKAGAFFPALLGNALLVAAVNAQQPINLGTDRLVRHFSVFCPDELKQIIRKSYPRWFLPADEFAIEEGAAWGWPLVFLAWMGLREKQRAGFQASRPMVAAAWCSAFFMMGMLASEALPRLLAPLYPLLFLPCSAANESKAPLKRKYLLLSLILLSSPLLLSPGRPGLPWKWLAEKIQGLGGGGKLAQRVLRVEQAYRQRPLGLRCLVPTDLEKPGMRLLLISNGNDTESPLWWPFGSRQVFSLQASDPLPKKAPDLILIRAMDWPQWSQRWGVRANQASRCEVTLLARLGPEEWYGMKPQFWPNQK